MTDSQKLLAEYARDRSEAAFREIVTRYIDLVYSTALRLVNKDAHRAHDITQTVFADLARQATKLSGDTLLGGWLHRDTCFVAAKVMRGERRREIRERQAAEMNALNAPENTFADISPILDEAINSLGEDDRKAILLRFYEQRDLRAVGEALGSSENAAQKRVARALEQLHGLLTRRGVALSAATLGTMLTAEAVTAAPIGLSTTIAGTALVSAVTAGAAFKLMSLTTLKFVAVGSLAAACIATPVIQHTALTKLRAENEAMQQQLDQPAAAVSKSSSPQAPTSESTQSSDGRESQLSELLRLRGEVGRLRNEVNEMSALKAENSRLKMEQARRVETIILPANIRETVNPSTDGRNTVIYTRSYEVDSKKFISQIPSSYLELDDEPSQPRNYTSVIKKLFEENDVKLLSANEALFLDVSRGRLIVRTTMTNLDQIETLLAKGFPAVDRNISVIRRPN